MTTEALLVRLTTFNIDASDDYDLHMEAAALIRQQQAEIARLRGAMGAHIQADAYRDAFPDDEQDAAYLRKQETWWRLTGRSWLDEDTASACARAAKERVAASPEHQALIAGLRAAHSQEPGR